MEICIDFVNRVNLQFSVLFVSIVQYVLNFALIFDCMYKYIPVELYMYRERCVDSFKWNSDQNDICPVKTNPVLVYAWILTKQIFMHVNNILFFLIHMSYTRITIWIYLWGNILTVEAYLCGFYLAYEMSVDTWSYILTNC